MLSASLTSHVFYKVVKGKPMPHDAFERMGLEERVIMEDLHLAKVSVNAHGHVLTFPLHAHTIVLEVEADRSFRIDFALELFAMRKLLLTASRAVSAVKSGRTSPVSHNEVPMSTMLQVSTTCCCFPSGSAGELETSLKSSCQ
jgi:hypothetical protein